MISIPEFTRRTTTPALARVSTSSRFSLVICEKASIPADSMNSVIEMKCKTIRMMCSSKKFMGLERGDALFSTCCSPLVEKP